MHAHLDAPALPPGKKRLHRQLYFWVLVGIVAGIVVGAVAPGFAAAMEPLGTTFVAAMRMLIGPIVFLTIINGIASVADIKKVGSTGVKALIYFQVGTVIAMAFGLIAINVFPLGRGINADPAVLQTTESVDKLISTGESMTWWEFLVHIVPESMAGPFVEGNILQIIFMAALFGIALNARASCTSG